MKNSCQDAKNQLGLPRNAAQRARDNHIKIFSIAFGDDADTALMSEIASITGGMYFLAPGAEDLQAVFGAVAQTTMVQLVSIPDD